MSNGMDKKISTGTGIAVIVALAVVVLLGVLWISKGDINKAPNIIPQQKAITPSNQPSASVQNGKQKACLDSGGTVATATCCGQTQDFPNNCAIGACGCAPASSHQIKICNCGEGKCFDGNSCVQASQFGGGDAGGSGSHGGATQCTMEAKVCPDGSAVGRTGPNCEFASCP